MKKLRFEQIGAQHEGAYRVWRGQERLGTVRRDATDRELWRAVRATGPVMDLVHAGPFRTRQLAAEALLSESQS